MTTQQRPLRQRPFNRETDYGAMNAFNKPLTGWHQEGVVDPEIGQLHGFVNVMGFGLMHVVNQKADGEKWLDLYDQFVLFENPGAIVVCTDEAGRVGLIQNYRLVGDRLEQALEALKNPTTGKIDFSGYVRTLRDRQLFCRALDGLGEMVWELPRGLAPAGDAKSLTDFAKKVAAVEAKEEGGFDVDPESIRTCGKVNANTTFFPHAQSVIAAKIVARGAQRPEELEVIGKVKMFTPEELRRMCDADELFDGLTLASLAKVGYRF